jgi:hypothetical protein
MVLKSREPSLVAEDVDAAADLCTAAAPQEEAAAAAIREAEGEAAVEAK